MFFDCYKSRLNRVISKSTQTKGGIDLVTIIAFVLALISTISFLTLWFMTVYRELRSRTDTVKSAENQLAECRKNHMLLSDSSDEQAAKSILSRSMDIYNQSVMLYNQTLNRPWNRIPGYLMGFRQIK